MSRAEERTKNHNAQVRALVNRQVQAWEMRDFAIAADDWLPNGELFSPGGHVLKKDMQSARSVAFIGQVVWEAFESPEHFGKRDGKYLFYRQSTN